MEKEIFCGARYAFSTMKELFVLYLKRFITKLKKIYIIHTILRLYTLYIHVGRKRHTFKARKNRIKTEYARKIKIIRFIERIFIYLFRESLRTNK